MNKIMMVLVAVAVLTIAAIVVADAPIPENLNRAVFKVDGLSCGGCFSTINAGLVELEGFSGMGTNLFRKIIAVDFEDPLTPEDISAKLADVGYPGELESVEAISGEQSFAYLESKRTRSGNVGGCGVGTCGVAPPSSGLSSQKGASCCTLNDNVNASKNL